MALGKNIIEIDISEFLVLFNLFPLFIFTKYIEEQRMLYLTACI